MLKSAFITHKNNKDFTFVLDSYAITMKQFIQKSIIVGFATFIFFVGAGFTVLDFCCKTCVAEQINIDSKKESCINTTASCCSDHEHLADDESHRHEHNCCENPHEGECCVAKRLSILLDSYQFRPQITSPFVWIEPAPVLDVNLQDVIAFNSDLSKQYKIPITALPRAYLSKLRVLII